VFIDESSAPLLFIRSQVQSDVPVERQLEDVLEKGQAFVLITDHSPDEHHDETPEERKKKALHFKTIKSRMQALCRGMIVIEGDTPTPAPTRLAATAASKAFGFAIAFVPNEQAAIEEGRRLLAKRAA
jgi:hypothetical protein